MDWSPIEVVGAPEPGEVDGRTGRTPLTYRLSATPPAEWSAFLVRAFEEQGQKRHWREMGVPMPRVRGSEITVWSTHSREQFAGWDQGVRAFVDEANSFYQRVVLPQIEEAERAAGQADKNRTRKLDEARQWVAEMGGYKGDEIE